MAANDMSLVKSSQESWCSEMWRKDLILRPAEIEYFLFGYRGSQEERPVRSSQSGTKRTYSIIKTTEEEIQA